MRDVTMMTELSKLEAILREAEKAHINEDCDALEGLSQQVPEGYVLVILSAFEQTDPCIGILSVEELTHLQGRFRRVEPVRSVVPSVPEAGQSSNSEPDGSPSQTGLPSSMEPNNEDDRGNL